MELRQIRRPKTYREPNPPNRAGVFSMGPLRFATGKNKGRIIPTRPNPVKQVKCARCTLPFVRGLQPARLVLGFDPKTGDAIDQYVHRACPAEVAKVRALIEERDRKAKEQENRRRKTTYGRRGFMGFIK